MRVGVVIQARTGSKRFPRKVLAKLNGIPVIQHVIDRCQQFGEKVILTVPFYDVGVFASFGVPVHYGPEDDVLSRYHAATKAFDLDPIFRITGDCPFIRPSLMEQTFKLWLRGHTYAAIDWPHGGWPKGYGCEVFSRFALELANAHARHPSEREHVTPWMRENLNCKYLQNDKNEAHLNYCVDYPEDIERLEKLSGPKD